MVQEEYKRKKSIKEAKRLLYLAKFPIVNGGAKNLFRTAASAGEIEGREGKGRVEFNRAMLFYATLCYTILSSPVFYCVILHFIVLYCIVL